MDLEDYRPEQVVEQLTAGERAMLATASTASERGRRLLLNLRAGTAQEAHRLVRLGLVDPRGEFRGPPYALNPQGRAVRAALLAQAGTGAGR